MDALEAIHTRRATRSFDTTAPTTAQLESLIEAASMAPSDLNRQPWSFAIIQGHDRIAAMEKEVQAIWLGESERGQDHHPEPEVLANMRALLESGFSMFHDAPATVVLLAPTNDEMAYLDTALAAQNVMIAAHAAGMATCPVALTHPYFDHPVTKAELGIPESLRVVLAIVVGFAAGPAPRAPFRPSPTVYWI